jgi:ribonucleotide reductase beta subunit family protein with ferritin-like domain
MKRNLTETLNELTKCMLKQKFFYGFQIMMENIHSETYSHIDGRDEAEKDKLFNALEVFQL